MNTINNKTGFTIVEVLIAVLLSGIVFTAGMKFYTAIQSQTNIQMELSNMQNTARTSLDDIKSSLRLAGYKLSSHDAFDLNGDSLSVFYNIHNPVDTITYYLRVKPSLGDDTYEEAGYSFLFPHRVDAQTFQLMKKTSFGSTSIYADNIVSVKFLKIADNIVRISITVQAEMQDESYKLNNGYRRWTLTEDVCLRNI